MISRNLLLLFSLTAVGAALAQAPDGRQAFLTRCTNCHGTDGNGGEHGPSILAQLQSHSDPEVRTIVHDGVPLRGMPAFSNIPDPEMTALVSFLRTLVAPGGGRGGRGGRGFQTRLKLQVDGKTMEGLALSQTGLAVDLRTDDGGIHLLRKNASADTFREVTSQSDWPNFNGEFNGSRYTAMTQIDKNNVKHLAPKWVYAVPNAGRMQGTPLVVGGIMYVPATNTVVALDAGTGARLWSFNRPPTQGLQGNARSLGNNRGMSVVGDRLFMQTDNAHLLALNRFDGKVIWEIEMADWHQNYNTTGSVLAVENMIIAGTAGGEEGVRGFVAAYDQQTGKEVWRLWTIPAKGEKGSETWEGDGILHGSGPTWLTGSYDPESKTVFWGTGNAGPDFNGDKRIGDNLYTCSILAIDLATGKLKWHFQTTPHDEWDWDATEPLTILDATWQGQPRKLLVQANRNGFLYVFDRTTGKMLMAKPLVKKLTWAKEIAPDGRPVMNPNNAPTAEGNLVCPAVEGAANFFSTSYNPITKLYYVNTLERCASYTKRETPEWVAGRGFGAGGGRRLPDEKSQKVLRAFDVQTGKVAWELPEAGQGDSWGGVLSTASGLVFYEDDGGALSVADATSGKQLWTYPIPETVHTSPMTYMFDNKQYVAAAIGGIVYSFGVME